MKAADQIFSDRPFGSRININKEYLPLVSQFIQSLRLVPRHLPLPKGGCEWYRRGLVVHDRSRRHDPAETDTMILLSCLSCQQTGFVV